MEAYYRLFAAYEGSKDGDLVSVLHKIKAHLYQNSHEPSTLVISWGEYKLLIEKTGIDLRKEMVKKSEVKEFIDRQQGRHIVLGYKKYVTYLYFDEQVASKKVIKATKPRAEKLLTVPLIESLEAFSKHIEITPSKCVFIDTETTGLFKADHVIELSVVDDVENALFDSLLKPKRKRKIHPKAMAAHGISEDRLAGKPRLIDVQQDVEAQLNGKYAVFYNANFDVAKMLHSSDGSIFDNCLGVVCLMKIYSEANGQRKWVKLVSACDAQNIDYSDLPNHRACGDARKLARLFKAFYPKLMLALDSNNQTLELF